jgi:hypothetical protein
MAPHEPNTTDLENIARLDRWLSEMSEGIDRLGDLLEWGDPPNELKPPAERGRSERHADDVWAAPDTPAGGRIGGPGWGSVGGSINAYPSMVGDVCHSTMLLVLPKEPRPPEVGGSEGVVIARRYFERALDATEHWAHVCRGRNLVIVTESWPVPPVDLRLSFYGVHFWPPEEVRRWLMAIGLPQHVVDSAVHRYEASGCDERAMRDLLNRYWDMEYPHRGRFGLRSPYTSWRFSGEYPSSLQTALGALARRRKLDVHVRLFVRRGALVSFPVLQVKGAGDWPGGW